MTDCSIIITTTNKQEIANKIARSLVEDKLARCVQIDKITSIYEWQGKIEDEEEYRLFIKAADKNIKEIESRILELHDYDLPEIIVLSITYGSQGYLEWLKNTKA